VGLLPGVAPGARLDTRIGPPAFVPIMVRLDAWSAATASGGGPGGDFFAATGSLGVCPERRGRSLAFDACLAGSAGVVRATGRDVPSPGRSRALVALVEGSVGASARVSGPLWLRASAGVAWGHRPDDWHVDAVDGSSVVVFRPWPVAVVGSLGLMIDFSPERSENRASTRHP
jgi:hypothetical protein